MLKLNKKKVVGYINGLRLSIQEELSLVRITSIEEAYQFALKIEEKSNKKYDNKIDAVYWSGTRCYCWVVVYQSKYFQGLNLGLWTSTDSGSYDLSYYITYDWNDMRWEPWDTTVSSYAIYCY